MKLKPYTVLTMYPKNVSFSVVPGSIYDIWLGMIFLTGSFSIQRMSSKNLYEIVSRGNISATDDANPLKRTKLLFPNNSVEYKQLQTNSIKITALEDDSSYLCFHHSVSPEMQRLSEKNNSWVFPKLEKSLLILKNNPITYQTSGEEYIFIADGTIKINNIQKDKNSWIALKNPKTLQIESITEDSVLAILK